MIWLAHPTTTVAQQTVVYQSPGPAGSPSNVHLFPATETDAVSTTGCVNASGNEQHGRTQQIMEIFRLPFWWYPGFSYFTLNPPFDQGDLRVLTFVNGISNAAGGTTMSGTTGLISYSSSMGVGTDTQEIQETYSVSVSGHVVTERFTVVINVNIDVIGGLNSNHFVEVDKRVIEKSSTYDVSTGIQQYSISDVLHATQSLLCLRPAYSAPAARRRRYC